MRARKGASSPGKPPHIHTTPSLKEINFDVRGNTAIIGPRKFPRSNFLNRPVPNVHEKGGVAIGVALRRRKVKQYHYPTRSIMWKPTKRLINRGRIGSEFNVTMRTNL